MTDGGRHFVAPSAAVSEQRSAGLDGPSGRPRLGDGSASGDKNYAVSTLADVDADTT